MMIKRVGISILIGIVFGIVLSELSFYFQHETSRPPQDVVLTIPEGTAKKVALGEASPSIPSDMVFVVGDTLVVKNEDTADHKLGPLWIPAKSSARLKLDQAQNLAYECSFQPDKYFGLEIHDALTMSTRIYGALYSGVPLGILFLLYSLAFPAKKPQNAAA